MWQADPYMTDRIISNLLNNAVKFSPENSGITVEIGVFAGGAGCPEYLESIIFINDEYLKISITDRCWNNLIDSRTKYLINFSR